MIPSVVFFLALLVAVVSAGQFGIKLDENIAPPLSENGKYHETKDGGWFLWSSIVGVTKTPSKGQLAKMAKDAYKEMQTDRAQLKIGSKYNPNLMVALAVDKEVFFASSMKNDGTYIYDPNNCDEQDKPKFRANLLEVPQTEQLKTVIEDCMNDAISESKNHMHSNQAKCGEVSVIYTWLLKHNGDTLRKKSPKPLIAAANAKELIDPCGTDSRLGCRDLVGAKGMDFQAVVKGVEDEDYDCISPKIIGQQELARKDRKKTPKRALEFEA